MSSIWVVGLEYRTESPVSEQLFTMLEVEGVPHDRYVRRRRAGPGVHVTVHIDASEAVDAASRAQEDIRPWLATHGLHGELMGLRVLSEEDWAREITTPRYTGSGISPLDLAQVLDAFPPQHTMSAAEELHRRFHISRCESTAEHDAGRCAPAHSSTPWPPG